MDDDSMRGLALLVYVLAYGGWVYIRQADETTADRATWRHAGAFSAGLVWLLFAAQKKFFAAPTLVVLALILLAIYSVLQPRVTKLLRRRSVRTWVAGTVLWLTAVWAWGAITDRELTELRALMLLPPAVAVLGAALFRWARSGEP